MESPGPPKVQAAQTFLYHVHNIRNPYSDSELATTQGRDLSTRETAAENAALDVLTKYFLGECEYGDTNSGYGPPEPPEPPKEPAPVK